MVPLQKLLNTDAYPTILPFLYLHGPNYSISHWQFNTPLNKYRPKQNNSSYYHLSFNANISCGKREVLLMGLDCFC
jgi:hypothetical protein